MARDCGINHDTLLKMKSYSVDFRQKIIDVYHNEPLCQKAIAERFCGASEFCSKMDQTVSSDPKYCSSNLSMWGST